MFKQVNNDEVFNRLMGINPNELEAQTHALATKILGLESYDIPEYVREMISLATTKIANGRALKGFVKPPSAAEAKATDEPEVLNNAKKGTEHHSLYKDMTKLSPIQKNQLTEKFGNTLTKFAVCNLILLYIEGAQINSDKGIERNSYAFSRRITDMFISSARDLKLEFFIHVLSQLCDPIPFKAYQNINENFIADVRNNGSASAAAKSYHDNISYIAAIKKTGFFSENTKNALSLFDARTLEIVNTGTTTLSYAESALTVYTEGNNSTLYQTPVVEEGGAPLSLKPDSRA